MVLSHAQAAGCNFDKQVNLSYEIDKNLIRKCIADGAKPPKKWRPKTGVSQGPGKTITGVVSNIAKGSNKCPRTITKDLTCAGMGIRGEDGLPVFPFCTGKPGGLSDGGALSVCDWGVGSPTKGVSGFSLGAPPGDNYFNCLTKLVDSIGSGNVGQMIDSNTNASGGCASGSVSVCGFGGGGSVCVDDEDKDGKNEVRLHGPLDVTLTPDVINWIWFLDGGTITMPDGSVITVAPGSKVEYAGNGLRINGGPVIPVPAGGGKVTAHFDGDAKIHDDVVKGGSLRNNPDGTPVN